MSSLRRGRQVGALKAMMETMVKLADILVMPELNRKN